MTISTEPSWYVRRTLLARLAAGDRPAPGGGDATALASLRERGLVDDDDRPTILGIHVLDEE